MKRRSWFVLLGLGALAAAGCAAPNTLYSWGKYDECLYAHYKNPAQLEEQLEATKSIIEKNEAEGRKMPPGLYAHYGYLLFQSGRGAEAIPCFDKEKATWPESAVLMDKLRRNVDRGGNAPPAATATAAAESAGGATK
ncbi:MAG: DUF4810 domain-containing protein [Deltaproteobacteria bacterium]|nr:DUF4810 domain-containing protein [Deltaproteobacteria bacterium]